MIKLAIIIIIAEVVLANYALLLTGNTHACTYYSVQVNRRSTILPRFHIERRARKHILITLSFLLYFEVKELHRMHSETAFVSHHNQQINKTASATKRKAAQAISFAFLLLLTLFVLTFSFPEHLLSSELFKSAVGKTRKTKELLLDLAHNEADQTTFSDVLVDQENEKEVWFAAHSEAASHDDDDDHDHALSENGTEDGGVEGASKASSSSSTQAQSASKSQEEKGLTRNQSKHPELTERVREKLEKYALAASAALVLKQEIGTARKCRAEECAKIGKGGVPRIATSKGAFASLGPLCVQSALLDAKATEFGLSWDRKTTKDDWFVHQKTMSEDSKFKEELLPESAKVVMKVIAQQQQQQSSSSSSSSTTKEWKTCALVGNSAILSSGPEAGKFIDAHDIVFRLNQAPTKKYEERVGKKTTVRILNKSWVLGYGGTLRLEHGNVKESDLPNEDGVIFLASRGNFQAITKLMNKFGGQATEEKLKVLRMNFKLYDVIAAQLKRFRSCLAEKKQTFTGGNTPSSGLMASLLLAGRCDEVNLYGFGPGVIRGKYQYYTLAGSERAHGESVHAFGLEFAFLKAMDKIGILKLCRPPMDDPRCTRSAVA